MKSLLIVLYSIVLVKNHMCIRLTISHVWYDTIDQAVVPINIDNECAEEVFVEVTIRDPKGNVLFSKLEKLGKGRRSVEVVLSYYGDADVCGEWWKESSTARVKIDCIQVKL